jgi:predicted anti-sigma-YlaC factor YlaD
MEAMEPNFSRWIRQVRDTQDEEIDCSACLDQLAQYVDLELATGAAAQSMPQVSHHLYQCAVCREEYEVLAELARLEERDELPAPEELIERLKRRQ